MSIDSVLMVNRQALGLEMARMEAASRNIAAANRPLAPGEAAEREVAAGFAGMLGDTSAATGAREAVPVRTVHDPAHPLADAEGNVRFARIDLVSEMATLMSASRAYEANVRAFNLLRSINAKALEIGGRNG